MLLFPDKDLSWDTPRGAVNAATGNLVRPRFGRVAKQRDVVRERLRREPTLADEGHLILDTRLVARMAYAGRVDEEAARLRVLSERRIDRWVLCAGSHDGGARVVEHDAMGDTAEELPCGIKPLDQRLGCLQERRPHELVATHGQRDDEHVQLASLAVGALDVAHQAEINLRFFTGRRIVDTHG